MNMHQRKLVTVVTEAFALEPLLAMLREEGALGVTHFRVQGAGAHGVRAGDLEEYGNVQVEVVVGAEVALRILTRLERDFFPRFAMIVHESDVRVLRSDKF